MAKVTFLMAYVHRKVCGDVVCVRRAKRKQKSCRICHSLALTFFLLLLFCSS